MDAVSAEFVKRRKRVLSPAQIRGARGMLGWSILALANRAQVSVSTIKRMEMEKIQPLSEGIYATVQAALEAAGIEFQPFDGTSEGLRLMRTC